MKKFYLFLTTLILIGLLPSLTSAQCGILTDGFEGASLAPNWTVGSGYTVALDTSTYTGGSQSLRITGSSSHYLGVSALFPGSQPPFVSFNIRPGSATAHDAYFVIGDSSCGSGGNNGIAFIYAQASTGNIRIIGSTSVTVPYVANVWYHVELRNINFTTNTYDVYVDGVFLGNIGFRTAGTHMSRVHLYNYSASTAWYDEIIIGGSNITTSFTASDPACFGDSTGTATLNVSGATGSVDYAWSTGDSMPTVSGLSAGTYTVSIVDSLGCAHDDTITLTEPSQLLSSTSNAAPTCNGDTDGWAVVSASGGTPAYTYLWNTGGTSDTLAGLAAGTYSVQVTDTNGCVVTETVTITEPAPVSPGLQSIDISCNGETDGSIDLTPSGGNPGPYTFAWSTGDSTEDLSGLGAGTYSVTVTDSLGCTGNGSATIIEPAVLGASGTVTDETNGAGNGSIDLTVTGGTSPYSFVWTGPGIFSSNLEDPTGLAAGEYIVLITDAHGCTQSDTFSVANVVGIVEAFSGASLEVYPNPFSAALQIDLQGNVEGTFHLELIDLTGKQVAALPAEKISGGFHQAWDLQDLPAGAYLLKATLNAETSFVRIVKQ